MQETIKLYDQDAYATDFEAEVLSCEEIEKKDGKVYQVILNQTLFFPEEGGQSPDMGTVNDIEVLDVQIKKEVITHTLSKPLTLGEKVKGKIDWTHRFYNMQQHSGEHIFSGLVHNKYGYDNVGFHLSDQIVTMDFNGILTWDQAEEIETQVNEAIVKNIPIEVTFPSKEELANMEYRSKIEIDGQVRIVTVPGYDVCACCAPHVRRTGEIGMLKLMTLQNYKGGVRISILCGFRALAAFREKAAIVSELMGIFTTNQEAIVDNVNKLKANNQSLKSKLGNANQLLMRSKLADIPAEQEDVLLFEESLDNNIMRATVNELTAGHKGFCGIFSGNEEEGYSFIIGSANKDCKALANALREKLGCRGGGSQQMIQGSIQAKAEDVTELIESLS